MKRTPKNDYIQLEKDITEAMRVAGDEKLRSIRDLMAQMAESSDRHVMITSYPAANSEA